MPHGRRIWISQAAKAFRKMLHGLLALLIVGGMLERVSEQSFAGPSVPSATNGSLQVGAPVRGLSGECIPQAGTFGYYESQWRVWPGERRPDRFFPQSIGVEAVPPPAGERIPELPRQKIAPEKPSLPPLPKLPTELPLTPPAEEPLLPSQPSKTPLLPSDKPIQIEQRPPLETPQPSPLEPIVPGKPGVQMPLPLEPLPGEKPSGQTPLPTLPTEPGGSPLVPGPGGSSQGAGGTRPMPSGPSPGPASTYPLEPIGPFQPDSPTLPPSAVPKTEASPPSVPQQKTPQLPSEAPEPKSSSWEYSAPGRAEYTPSRTPALDEPVEPWAEPKPWHPSSARPNLPSTEGPEAPPIGASARYGAGRSRAAHQAVYQAEMLSEPSLSGSVRPDVSYGLEGYCPVSLMERELWVPGDPRFAMEYQGKVYLLAGENQRQRFLANPLRYIPAGGGADPVVAVEENRQVLGRTDYCAVYDGRLYLFSGPDSLTRFHQNPKRYASFSRPLP